MPAPSLVPTCTFTSRSFLPPTLPRTPHLNPHLPTQALSPLVVVHNVGLDSTRAVHNVPWRHPSLPRPYVPSRSCLFSYYLDSRTTPAMEQGSPYHHQHQHQQHQPHHQSHSHSHQSRQQLFPQGGQLPPPSSLNLPMPTFTRTNTLPPIPAMSHPPPDSRYPPPSYHPSLSTPTSSAGLASPTTAGSAAPWSGHRTSSSRDDSHSTIRRRESKGKLIDSPGPSNGVRERDSQQQGSSRGQVPSGQDQKDGDDGMNSTSDFVKKLYKYVLFYFICFCSNRSSAQFNDFRFPFFLYVQNAGRCFLSTCCILESSW